MTGGGLMQLVAYGAQDVYLTGNPQVTFFKQLYRRHTNFAMQSVEAQFNGAIDWGRRVSLIVPRVGDLMGRVYLEATLPSVDPDGDRSFTWDTDVGNFLINYIEVQIGGQIIDKHYGTWLSIWAQLTLPAGKVQGYNAMIGNFSHDNQFSPSSFTVYVPLQFWFCRHEGLALPLIALQYHEVRFVVQFAKFEDLIDKQSEAQYGFPQASDNHFTEKGIPRLVDARLYIDYIFLDTDERRKFAQTSHEYLIDQLQFTGDEIITGESAKIKLNFNHPVKELIWVIMSTERKNRHFSLPLIVSEDNNTQTLDPDVSNGSNPVGSCKLQFNGHDRFSERAGKYFSDVQPYQHHTNIPTEPGINVYSFALYPELEQPSGTANFSRIDNATLTLKLSQAAKEEDQPVGSENKSLDQLQHRAKIYAVNYNVLRIMSGMGGLAYSN